MKKRYILVLFIVLLISISGCKLTGKKDTNKALEEVRTGTEGVAISFLPNAPPDKIVVEEGATDNSFDVILELRNKGAYPQPEDRVSAPVDGKVYLSGYDINIIYFDKHPPSDDFSNKPLEGKSTINPNGGLDLTTFKGHVNVENLNVERYEPTLLATACYKYQTMAGPQVCIDPDPYSTISQKKVCTVQDISLTNQGAPIAVTKISEEAFATKTQFRLTIKNVGNGDVFKDSSINKCSPSGEKVGREDIDKVYIGYVKIGNKELICGPFVDRPNQDVRERAGYVRLINGEGYVICELQSSDYSPGKSAYTTPINILLLYAYRNTAEKKILIKKETSGLGGGGSSQAVSEPQQDRERYMSIGGGQAET